jgi:hypothetical protein
VPKWGATIILSGRPAGWSSVFALRDDGLRIEVRGIDLFELRVGKIARQDTYRKQRT